MLPTPHQGAHEGWTELRKLRKHAQREQAGKYSNSIQATYEQVQQKYAGFIVISRAIAAMVHSSRQNSPSHDYESALSMEIKPEHLVGMQHATSC
jgi:predicted transcriptional regulator